MPHARRKGAILSSAEYSVQRDCTEYMYNHPSAPLTALRRAYSVDEVSPARALGNGPDTVTVTVTVTATVTVTVTVTGERKVDAN